MCSRCLSAAGLRFLGLRFPLRSSALLASGLPADRRTPTGFPRSALRRCGRVGCHLYSGAVWCPRMTAQRRHASMQVRKVCIHWPSIAAVAIVRRPRLTEPQRWLPGVHPSDLPLARLSRMARVGLGHFPLLCSGSLPTTPIGAGTVVDTQLGRNHLLYHSSVRPRVARPDPLSGPLSGPPNRCGSRIFNPLNR